MKHQVISLDCGLRQLMHAQEELSSLSGVIAAEVLPGRSALRVWQGEELPAAALSDALTRCGLAPGQVHMR